MMLLIFIKKTSIIYFTLNHISFLFLLFLSFSLFILNLLLIAYNKRNILLLLLTMEMMFLSIILNFCFLSINQLKISQVLALFILSVAATESSIGLSLIICLYRLKQNIGLKNISDLKN